MYCELVGLQRAIALHRRISLTDAAAEPIETSSGALWKTSRWLGLGFLGLGCLGLRCLGMD